MKNYNRREFLKTTAAAAALAGLPAFSARGQDIAPPSGPQKAWAVREGDDDVSRSPQVAWAIERLNAELRDKSIYAETPSPNHLAIVARGGPPDTEVSGVLQAAHVSLPPDPESCLILFASKIFRGSDGIAMTGNGLYAIGHDSRGVVYALLELADRVRYAADGPAAMAALQPAKPIIEKPANKVRGIVKMFASELDDKPWFYDQKFWTNYLDMLATERFNRFNLSFGLAYDFARNLTDTYAYFAYPFFLNVPGYNVRAVAKNGQAVPAEEQKKNLEALKFIADECAKRGIDFFLGIWTHAFTWTNSPNATHVIQGLTDQTQGAYCRDALHLLLDSLPNVKGLTMRTHGESGVPEGSYDIWKTIMSGVTGLKTADGKPREIRFDLHGKSMTREMIDTAATTQMPIEISCKFWAEHCGLPYIQSRVRDTEMPKRDSGGLMALSDGSRNFLRYGYGDLLTSDRKYRIVHRLWHGTQRVLLWGDPLYAAEYARLWNILGSDGADYFEPLTFKGRCGSHVEPAVAGAGRTGYANAELVPAGGDWTKYLYTYRLWGRTLYNPDCDAEVWRRMLKSHWSSDAGTLEKSLAAASRILPTITTAHEPSASNANYWPENYLNMSLVDAARPGPYTDSPTPHVFGMVSPLDPQMFAACNEQAEALLAVKPLAKINPLEVAESLERWAQQAEDNLAFNTRILGPVAERARVDMVIAAGIGRFFAAKFRAAILLAIYQKTAVTKARDEAVAAYKQARDAWAAMLPAAAAYVDNVSFGGGAQLHGHWKDRLPAIDADIQLVAKAAPAIAPTDIPDQKAASKAIDAILKNTAGTAARPKIEFQHIAPQTFTPGQDFSIRFTGLVKSVRLVYRHVNQGENWQSAPMQDMMINSPSFQAAIPAAYTNSPFGLQYYFEVETADGQAGMHPGFKENFTGTPYFVVPKG